MDTGAIGRPHHAPQLPAGKPQAAPITDGPTGPIRHPPEGRHGAGSGQADGLGVYRMME